MAINTINATIQMRKGLERDFDADQMTAGEWAVSTDAKYVRMCFAPGIVLRMATYEGFEADMEEVQAILKECQDIQVSVDAMAKAAQNSKTSAEASSKLSESWAKGSTGVRPGENTNNSKYFSDLAKALTDEAEKLLDQAQKVIVAATQGALIPGGTVTFENLPTNPATGYMYNISNDFTTDSRFEDGAGVFYRAGANVYWTAGGKWDVLIGTQVTGVKGAKESSYRVGNVNLTPANIGALDENSPVYSLQGGNRIPDNADLNDYKTPGNYYVNYTSSAGTIANLPPALKYTFILKVEATVGQPSTHYVRQILKFCNTNKVWVRYILGGSDWTAWEDIAENPIVSFTEPADVANILPNITLGSNLGRISKWFSVYQPVWGGSPKYSNKDLTSQGYYEIANCWYSGTLLLMLGNVYNANANDFEMTILISFKYIFENGAIVYYVDYKVLSLVGIPVSVIDKIKIVIEGGKYHFLVHYKLNATNKIYCKIFAVNSQATNVELVNFEPETSAIASISNPKIIDLKSDSDLKTQYIRLLTNGFKSFTIPANTSGLFIQDAIQNAAGTGYYVRIESSKLIANRPTVLANVSFRFATNNPDLEFALIIANAQSNTYRKKGFWNGSNYANDMSGCIRLEKDQSLGVAIVNKTSEAISANIDAELFVTFLVTS